MKAEKRCAACVARDPASGNTNVHTGSSSNALAYMAAIVARSSGPALRTVVMADILDLREAVGANRLRFQNSLRTFDSMPRSSS